MSEFGFRWAVPEDAADFAEWAAKNTDIPDADIKAAMKENNPTSTVLVITKDNRPIVFIPLYLTVRLAFLGFNPATTARERIEALEMIVMALKSFAALWNIREINTLTKATFPVGKWAAKNGFVPDDRELYTLAISEEKAV